MSAPDRPSSEPTPTTPDDRNARATELLDAAAHEFASGASSHAGRWLKAGALTREYVRHRQGIGHSRTAAVAALKGKLAETAGGTVDVNRLMQTAAVVEILAGGVSAWLERQPPAWGKLVELAPLCFRDPKTEDYSLKPGISPDAARALFAAVVGSPGVPSLPRLDVRRKVAELLGVPVRTPGCKPAERPTAEEPRVMPRIAPQPADAHELAASVLDLVRESDAPDDVVAELLGMLAQSNDLSRQAKRAVQAALLLLRRDSTPSPAEVADAFSPNRNGHLDHATS